MPDVAAALTRRPRIAASRPQARPHADRAMPATIRRCPSWLVPTGIAELDARLEGGLPRGHLSEVVGPRSSGRLAMLVSALAGATARGEAVALIDPLDMFDPVSASPAASISRGCCGCAARRPARRASACRANTARCRRALDRAVKALNLVLQAGGFGLVVLDLGEVAAADASSGCRTPPGCACIASSKAARPRAC